MTDSALSTVVDTTAMLSEARVTYLSGRADHTVRAYAERLDKFLAWHAEQPSAPFVAQLRAYIAYLQDSGLSARSVQAHVATIKGLLRTAAALDTSGSLALALPSLDLARPPAVRGELQGNRLSDKQRQALINAPGVTSHKGRRDTAMLALMAVCGLRRSEVCNLEWQHIGELEGHKVIRNLQGKHGRVRTLKLPPALWRRIVEYAELADIDRGPASPVFVAIGKGDRPGRQKLSGQALAYLVQQYCDKAMIGIGKLTPHDLRRTAAIRSRKAGASIEQVQLMLGHASPQTTSAYIGETLDLDDNAVDYGKVLIP